MSITNFDPNEYLKMFDDETSRLDENYDILPRYGDADALHEHADGFVPAYSYQLLRLFEYMRSDAEEHVVEALENNYHENSLDSLLSYAVYCVLFNRASAQRMREANE